MLSAYFLLYSDFFEAIQVTSVATSPLTNGRTKQVANVMATGCRGERFGQAPPKNADPPVAIWGETEPP